MQRVRSVAAALATAAAFGRGVSAFKAGAPVTLWGGLECRADGGAVEFVENSGCACDTVVPGARAAIIQGYSRDAPDRLACENCDALSVEPVWDEGTGVLSMTGAGLTLATYAQAIASVTFRTTEATAPRTITYNFGHGVYVPEAGRHYERFPCADAASCTWRAAQTQCADAGNDLLGLAGYLAAPASAEQAAGLLIAGRGGGWLGGTDEAVANEWRWVTGPDGCPPDLQSMGPTRTGCANTGQGTLLGAGVGADFMRDGEAYVNWAEGYPTDAAGHDFMYMLPGGDGLWENVPDNTAMQGEARGYFCAWGGEGFGMLCLVQTHGEAVLVPPEADSGAPVWLVSALVTLVLIGVVLIAVLAVHYRLKFATAVRDREAPLGDDVYDAEYGVFAGLMTEHYVDNAVASPSLELAVPLKQREKQLLADVFLHLHTATPPADLPLAPDSFPRGAGASFFKFTPHGLTTSLELFYARVSQMWYAPPGTLYDELLRNLRFPESDRMNCHTVIREVALGAWHHPGVSAVAGLADIGPLQLLCMLLYSQEGHDIDRLLLHRDAPVWAPGNDISKRAYERYEPSNGSIYRDLDASGQEVVVSRLFGNRLHSSVLHSKWIKTASLLSALAVPHPARAAPLFRAFHALDERIELGTYLVFPTPLTCTADLDAARAFLTHKRRYQPFEPPAAQPAVLFRIFHVTRSLDLMGTSQYPVEAPVLLPLFTPFRVDSIRSEQDVLIVDLHMEEDVKFLDTSALTRFKRDVLEDAWEGEERVNRVGAVLERHGVRPPTAHPELMTGTAIRVDPSGCVRGNVRGSETDDATRCHECGVYAHGMPLALKQRYDADNARELDQQRQLKLKREKSPKRLWVVGAPQELCGMYAYVRENRTWQRNGYVIRHLGNRWALLAPGSATEALVMSVSECPVRTSPHTVVRWARPLDGGWTEDPNVRIALSRPHEVPARSTADEGEVELPEVDTHGYTHSHVASFQSFGSPMRRTLLG